MQYSHHSQGLYSRITIYLQSKRKRMKKSVICRMSTLVLTIAGLISCSSNNEEYITGGMPSGLEGNTGTASYSRGDMNVLQITSDDGDTETCWLNPIPCGRIGWSVTVCDPDRNYDVYPMVFSAYVNNSSVFNVMQIEYESRDNIWVDDLEVGDTLKNYIRFRAWKEDSPNGTIRWQNSPGAHGGHIEVVNIMTDETGQSTITLKLQDLKLNGWSACCLDCDYTFNGLIEFKISQDGIYPDDGFDPESLLIPRNELSFFMLDALHSSESAGRQTFFSEGPEEQECLLINSEEEFRAAYKGDKEVPKTWINFDYCTLVIGRTYGEHGGISVGGFEVTDLGDTYQLDVTLNNNVNPGYAYTAAFTDLYFWKICPKMEQKPVVFNRIRQDVNIDPSSNANAQIIHRWTLWGYTDADGKVHQHESGMERYAIEFKEDGHQLVGSIDDTDIFSCHYMLPYAAKRAYYEDLDHGLINLWDWEAAQVGDDDPILQKMMRIAKATQFYLLTNPNLVVNLLNLYISPEECLMFQHEVVKTGDDGI